MQAIYQIRVAIQTTSPMAIQSGHEQGLGDNQIAMDGNYLPYIPATSFIGVWRSLVRSEMSEEAAETWFGHQNRRAILSVTNGYLHDSQQRPVTGLIAADTIQRDPILSKIHTCDEQKEGIIKRHRNRINDRGVTHNTGKFEQLLLPTGLEYSFKIRGILDAEQEQELKQVLGLLEHPAFALGSNVTNGLGRFTLIESLSKMQVTPLISEQADKAYKVNAFNREWMVPALSLELATQQQREDNILCRIPIASNGPWTLGTHKETWHKYEGNDAPDCKFYFEKHVVRKQNSVSVEEQIVAPGSSLKGIFAHRVLYHLHCMNQYFAEDIDTQAPTKNYTSSQVGELVQAHEAYFAYKPAAFYELFGQIEQDYGSENATAGTLIISDAKVSHEGTEVRYHNAINRFTGGTIDRALYRNEVLSNVSFMFEIAMLPRAADIIENDAVLRMAIYRTLEDIQAGRLALGSQTGRGMSMTGTNKKAAVQPQFNAIFSKQEQQSA